MIRQFKLWNHDKSTSFDFKAKGIIITEVSGLGLNFTATISNGAVVEYNKEFEPISLQANFGVNTNAYTAFNEFANFIRDNGRRSLVLEYTVNGRTVYADVWLTRMPKSQKTNFNILTETLQFTRINHWYTIEEGPIPYGEFGDNYTGIVIENPTDDNIELIIEIPINSYAILGTYKITAYDNDFNTIVEINLTGAIPEGTLVIDSENKKVTVVESNTTSNGYNYIDRTGDTFMVLGKGSYRLMTNQASGYNPTFRFKKWVID